MVPRMRVCLVTVEFFAWGRYGGFGRAARTIGRELARRGVEVTAVVPQRRGQRPVEQVDGVTVLGFPPHAPWRAAELYRACDADIYHSQEPSFGTVVAARAAPDRKHVVTFRDPRRLDDWKVEFRLPSLNKLQVVANWLYEDNPLVGRAVRRADATFCAAEHLLTKVRAKYRVPNPRFLPTPVHVPERVEKARTPTVCFLARWDRRKRPELFFELARSFPRVTFVAVGRARDQAYEAELRQAYGHLPNLRLVGFIDQFRSAELSQILEQSWVVVNTAAREGLPNAFLEAAAHRCAILSAVDPDGFASRFGHHVRGDDFAGGLATLLDRDTWRERGERGCEHVRARFETGHAIQRHLAAYDEVLSIS